MAFIPTIYIIPLFEFLVEIAKTLKNPNLDSFITYFSKEWIKGTEFEYWNYYNDLRLKLITPQKAIIIKLIKFLKIKTHFYIMLYKNIEFL